MLSELLQDRASLYVSGAMTAPERENFELILEFHDELRRMVAGLEEVGTAVVRRAGKRTQGGLKLSRQDFSQPHHAAADAGLDGAERLSQLHCDFALSE